jgi:hypothetical protein
MAAMLFVSACSLVNKSPSGVVEAAYMAGNRGEYSEAEKYLSSEALNAIKGGLGTLGGGTKGIWDRETRNGTIEKIEITKEEIRGEGATVYFKVYFKDGSSKDTKEPLVKETGQWKITIG